MNDPRNTWCARTVVAFAFMGTLSVSAELLYSDNFNVANNDLNTASEPVGRFGGTLAGAVIPRSAIVQQQISGNQLFMVDHAIAGYTGRMRFDAPSETQRFDWAQGPGSTILSEGTLRVEFDWTRATGPQWIGFSIGIDGYASEPNQRIDHSGTDYGILFRNTGDGTQRFEKGVASTVGSFSASDNPMHVVLDFGLNSFTNGALVSAKISIDGTQVDNHSFDLNGNNGALYMELETNQTGMLVDNFSVSAIPEPSSLGLMMVAGGAVLSIRRRKKGKAVLIRFF